MNNPAVTQIGFLVIFIVIMYLLLIRPQRKKERQVNDMRNSVQVGDEIITIGGICGQVVKTRGENLTIQVGSDKVKFEIMRWAVSKIESTEKRRSEKKARFEPDKEDYAEELGEAKKSLPKRMKRAASEDDEPEADKDE